MNYYSWQGYGSDYGDSSSGEQNPQGLLGKGWRPLDKQFDPDYFLHLLTHDTGKMLSKSLNLVSSCADILGRHQYSWWANLLGVFSGGIQYELNEFWNYITPPLKKNDRYYNRIFNVDAPVSPATMREFPPLGYAMARLEEIALFKMLELLGTPDLILQHIGDRSYYYPLQQFNGWERLDILGQVNAYWRGENGIRLDISPCDGTRYHYALWGNDVDALIEKATYNLSVLVSGYQTRVGKVFSQYPIESFPEDIRNFTYELQEEIFKGERLAVLTQGEPGTGKTMWTQAVAREILVPLGYVVFILDHAAVENFIPPSYLQKVCLIINEADNLARDRASEIGQMSDKTEHILSLLDGTLYQSVIDEANPYPRQKLVILMTCNTTERLDPAFLRKGRVDYIYEFKHRFV